ncbi:PREDICTED: CRISP/Allergen/PR-1-like [Nicrophorus vespilloides]|uniref:CRISP/Allergen/PR-1-like n=1 Tax=Nicrophorus vespilloides TaxID=110193 RepID=A0ABM1MHK1_NICVS|nr:PREDICTED: CRISP/Allergen/PR-1-like [Nicrophorus vespilloides]
MSLKQLLIFVLIVAFTVGNKCPSGGKIYERGISEGGIKEIVDDHNYYRTLIANGKVKNQPRGVNLKRLVYDKALASKARTISDTCDFNHITIKDDRWKVGQNLARVMSNKLEEKPVQDWKKIITTWFDEHKLFVFPNITSPKTGHYSQVVWANSKFIGCDFVYYYDVDKPKSPYTKLYTCNYGPGGNVKGEAPYKTGKSGCENLC